MPKILFLTCWYPTEENPSAGVFIREHAQAVRLSGVDITVLHLNVKRGGSFLKTHHIVAESFGIPTIVLNIESIFWKWIYQIPWFLWLIIMNNFKSPFFSFLSGIDLIHSHVIFPAGIIGHKLSGILGVPQIISEHWTKTERFLKTSPFSFSARHAYNSSSAVLPVSLELEGIIKDNCPQLKNIQVVPNIVDAGIFSYKKKPQTSQIVFSAAGVWQKKRNFMKRPDLFIEALGRLKGKMDKGFKLLIAGGGNLTYELQKKCENLGIEVEIRGFLSKKEIASMLQESSFFLHASEFETFGVVVYEALATGTPVIASRLTVFEDLIDETNGVLCRNTIDEWEKGITLAFQRDYNYSGISETFREKYSYRSVGKLLTDIYNKVLPVN